MKLTPTPTPCTESAICLNPAIKPGIRPFIDTWNNIHVIQVADDKFVHNDFAAYGKADDLVWNVAPGKISQWHAVNPDAILSYYLPLNRDAGTFDDPNLVHDPLTRLRFWQANHPDWLMYRCDQKTPATQFRDPGLVLDITNPDVIAWQIQTYIAPASEAGYDAIALDNVNMAVPGDENADSTPDMLSCGHFHNGQWVRKYNGQQNDPQWRTDVLNWLTKIQAAMHNLPHPMSLIANFDAPPLSISDPFLQQIVAHFDGVVDERGFTNYTSSYVSDDAWTALIQFIQNTQAQNKAYFTIDEFTCPPGKGVSNDQVQWALSNYLLVKEHMAAVIPVCNQDYGQPRPRDEYNAKIGYPLDDTYLNQLVYWRDYSNGQVIVNPSSSTNFTVTLSSTHYIDLYGKAVGQSVALAPHSGIVLLNKA